MRKKVRGLRKIERAVLKRQGGEAARRLAAHDPEATTATAGPPDRPRSAPEADSAGAVVLDSCAAVRGILNDDQGGPLHPPGVRMAEALQDMHDSLQRNLAAKKGGAPRSNCANSKGVSTVACKRSPKSKSRSRSRSKR